MCEWIDTLNGLRSKENETLINVYRFEMLILCFVSKHFQMNKLIYWIWSVQIRSVGKLPSVLFSSSELYFEVGEILDGGFASPLNDFLDRFSSMEPGIPLNKLRRWFKKKKKKEAAVKIHFQRIHQEINQLQIYASPKRDDPTDAQNENVLTDERIH